MSNGADWFARKLGGAPRSVPAPRPAVGGLRLPAAQPPQASQPAHTATAPPLPPTGTTAITGHENFKDLVAAKQANGEYVTFTGLSRHWKGGEALATEGTTTCPKCGSMNIFTRQNVRVMNTNGVSGHARPRCFECGFQPGAGFTPGEKTNWG